MGRHFVFLFGDILWSGQAEPFCRPAPHDGAAAARSGGQAPTGVEDPAKNRTPGMRKADSWRVFGRAVLRQRRLDKITRSCDAWVIDQSVHNC
jgi:hypothetical protein